MIVGEDQIQIGIWNMHNDYLFGTNGFNIVMMHWLIMNHFGMMTPTLFVRCITRLVIGNPNSRPQSQQGYVPNSTTHETMVPHIHSMVDEANNPSYEALYIFRKMVRDQGFDCFKYDCFKYVHEADRVHVSANYRRDVVQPVQLHPQVRRRGKGGVAGRREHVAERGKVPVEMDQATQNAQAASEDDQATFSYNIGSISRGCSHEFTQASIMINQLSQTDIIP